MSNGIRISDEQRSLFTTRLLIGDTLSGAAKACGVPRTTAYSWVESDEELEKIVIRRNLRRDVIDHLDNYLIQLLHALGAQAEIAGSKEYLERQPGRDLSSIHETTAKLTFNMITGMNVPALPEDLIRECLDHAVGESPTGTSTGKNA
jgi:hypothetical protein